MFHRNQPSARPVYSTAASHWGCTLLIALLLSVWSEVRMPGIVAEWSEVAVRLAHSIVEARDFPTCTLAERATPARQRITDTQLGTS